MADNSEAILRTVGDAIGYLQHIQGMVGKALDSQAKRRMMLGHLAGFVAALGLRPLALFASAFWPLTILNGCSLLLQTWLRGACSQVRLVCPVLWMDGAVAASGELKTQMLPAVS